MRVRFIKQHNGHAIGDEIDVDSGVADAICNWAKAAEYVTADAPKPALDHASDKMMHAPSEKRRGRPPGSKNLVRTK